MSAITCRPAGKPAASPLALVLLVWVTALYVLVHVLIAYADIGSFGADARAYWLSGHSHDLYGRAPGTWGAYLYTPAFAQFIRPLTLLPLTAFSVVWIGAEAAVFAWLLRPLGWQWGIPAFLLCAPELGWGNVYAFYALTLAVGLRRPAMWAIPLLTKLSPAVGVVWFIARREWRSLAMASGTAGVIALVSFAFAPGEWSAWVGFLHAHSTTTAELRVAGGILVTLIAARRGARWLLVPAMILACPLINALVALSLFAALPRMLEIDRLEQAVAPPRTADTTHSLPA